MEALTRTGVNLDLPKNALVDSLLLSHSEEQLNDIRTQLFNSATLAGLAHPKDVLVKRLKRATGPSLTMKYANDVAVLCYAIKNCQPLPRTLLRNGKRSAAAYITSRDGLASPSTHIDSSVPDTPSCPYPSHSDQRHLNSNVESSESHGEEKSITILTREISTLRCELTQLRSEIIDIRSICQPSAATGICFLYVRLKSLPAHGEVGKSMLGSLLQCPILCYTIIRHSPTMTLKIKVLKTHLYTALTSCNNQLATVRAWKAKPLFSAPKQNNNNNSPPLSPSDQAHHHSPVRLTTWNCRGLNSGEPYIHQLAEEGCDIIAISEHWLWPFESNRLCQIHPSFTAELKTDPRLNENSTLSRGCGGVGLMWRKSLNATPIPSISSDRICGIRISLSRPDKAGLSVFGVYLPCADVGIESYCEHLVELENLISDSQHHVPVVIVGDFNAHLGSLGGVRGHGSPNQQGVLLHQLLVRCNLYAVSLSPLSEGPEYTFWNSTTRTTVDYVIASHDASDYIQGCFTHQLAPLNNSDHLPISTVLCVPSTTTAPLKTSKSPKINWKKALESNQLVNYQKLVASIVTPLLGRPYNNQNEINTEICSVSEQLTTAAQTVLPLCNTPKMKKNWYKDQALGHLALRKKAAWDEWSANGRPNEGPLYDAKIRSRAEFRKRMKICGANEEGKTSDNLTNGSNNDPLIVSIYPRKKLVRAHHYGLIST